MFAHVVLERDFCYDRKMHGVDWPAILKRCMPLVDRASIEAFVNRDEISSPRFALPKENGLPMKAEDGRVTIQSLTVHPLSSAWTDEIGDVGQTLSNGAQLPKE